MVVILFVVFGHYFPDSDGGCDILWEASGFGDGNIGGDDFRYCSE